MHEAFDLGRASGQPDAGIFFVYQRAVVWFEQGRLPNWNPPSTTDDGSFLAYPD